MDTPQRPVLALRAILGEVPTPARFAFAAVLLPLGLCLGALWRSRSMGASAAAGTWGIVGVWAYPLIHRPESRLLADDVSWDPLELAGRLLGFALCLALAGLVFDLGQARRRSAGGATRDRVAG